MDLSKLPKLSDTQKNIPQPPQAPPVSEQPSYSRPRPVAGIGGEVWISIAIGLIMLLMYPRFLQWTSSRIFGTHFDEFMLDGVVVPYPQVHAFWEDLGPTTFGIVLIVEGLALAFVHKRSVLWVAFVLTVAATAFNLVFVMVSYSEYGLAMVSAIAVAFGGYIAMYQWKLLRT